MPFVEVPPALSEPVAGMTGTWRGRLPDGTAVTVRRYEGLAGSEARTAVARLRAIATVRHERLVSPLGAATAEDGLAVLYPADVGRGLDSFQEPLPPPVGLLVAEDLLAALGALHAAGQAHGAIDSTSVRVSGADGAATLWAPAPGAPSSPDARRQDVRAVAELICRAMGLPVEWTPSDPLRDVERSAPALSATLRALAGGGLPLDAAGALEAVREAAGGLGGGESTDAARSALRELATGGVQAAEPPARLPHHPAHVAPSALAPLEPRARPLLVPIAIVAGLLLLVAVGAVSFKLASRSEPPTTSRQTVSPPPASPAASPAPSPSVPPLSARTVHSVAATAQGSCAIGASCVVEVTVYFARTTAPEDVSWQFQLVDQCTGDATYVDGNRIQAKAGWTHVIGDTPLRLPAGHPLSVIAVTITPDQAASPPLLLPGGTC